MAHYAATSSGCTAVCAAVEAKVCRALSSVIVGSRFGAGYSGRVREPGPHALDLRGRGTRRLPPRWVARCRDRAV